MPERARTVWTRRPSLLPLTVVAVGLASQETTQADPAVQVAAVPLLTTLALMLMLVVLLQEAVQVMLVVPLPWLHTLVGSTLLPVVVAQEPLGAIPTVPLVEVLILALMVVLVRAA